MYDKDEINAVAILYSETGADCDFECLLKVLEPMIEKILLRYPKYEEFYEDLKQEIYCLMIKRFSRGRFKKIFKKHIPTAYLFYVIRRYHLEVIPTVDPSFDPEHPSISKLSPYHPKNINLSDQEILHGISNRKSSGYNLYDNAILSFEELTVKEKRKIISDVKFDEDEEK